MTYPKHITALLLSVCVVQINAADLELPKPLPFTACENEVPDGLIGSWRVDRKSQNEKNENYVATLDEPQNLHQPSGSPEDDSSLMIFAADKVTFKVPGLLEVQRNYRILQVIDTTYLIQMSDAAGAIYEPAIEMVSCGLKMEGATSCHDPFCLNLVEETFRQAMEKLAPPMSAENFEHLIESQVKKASSEQTATKPPVIYRRVTTEAIEPPEDDGIEP